ncbi:MAG: hypothetical protein IJN63_05935, partial [Clostridia bacterium]|nr:hypothetical protein [Clostridia bacterium]
TDYSGFIFTLVPEGSAPAASGNGITAADGSASFEIVFTKDHIGTFTYVLSETAGSIDGMTYDTAPRTVTITVVKNASNELEATVVCGNDSGNGSLTVDFENTYNKDLPVVPPTPVDVVINVDKDVVNKGTDSYDGGLDGFKFTITPEGNAPAAEGTGIGITDENGAASFSIRFTEEGTYTYTLGEHHGGAPYMHYDTLPRTVTVVVTKEGNALVASVTCGEATGNGSITVSFVNEYHKDLPVEPDDIIVNVHVDKTVKSIGTKLYGGNLAGFVFTLVPQGNAPSVGGNGVTDANGHTFFGIVFTKDDIGTYTYVLSETAGSIEGMTYDTAPRTVTVSVSLNADNELVASVSCGNNVGVNGVIAEKFENVYDVDLPLPDPDPVDVTVTIDKTVRNTGDYTHGRGGFEFVIDAVNGGPTCGNVFTNANGYASFVLTFDKSHIGHSYNYRIYEKAGNVTGMTYTDKVYNITVTVRDGGNNTIVAVISDASGDHGDTYNASFVNTYHVEAPTPPPVAPVTVVIDSITRIVNESAQAIGPGGFKVEISSKDGSHKQVLTTDKNGKVVFDGFRFNEDDANATYEYTVRVINEGKDGIIYDETVHNIKITVLHGGTELSVIITDGEKVSGDGTFTVEFEHRYRKEEKIPDISVDIDSVVTVVGTGSSVISPEGFKIEFARKDGGDKQIVTVDKDGRIDLKDLIFTKDDIGKTFEYTVRMVNEGKEGVTYDDRIYELVITVALGPDNKLIATITDGTVTRTDGKYIAEFSVNYVEPESPPTGDATSLMLAMLAAAAAMAVGITVGKSKKRRKDDL